MSAVEGHVVASVGMENGVCKSVKNFLRMQFSRNGDLLASVAADVELIPGTQTAAGNSVLHLGKQYVLSVPAVVEFGCLTALRDV